MASGVFTRSSHDFLISTPAQPSLDMQAGLLRRFVGMLAVWYDREVSRRRLGMMDERALRDIGITRAQADAEATRPFWQG